MAKISDLNCYQHMASADNVKPKNEVLNTWCVGMNDFARNAEGQDSRRNILSPGAFLEFLAKIFTLGYVDFSKCSNEAGRNMMAHIESSSYIKNNDGSEIMNFVMNNPEGERADSSKVIIGSNEAGRNMMAHIESSSYIKNNDGSEIMNFVMNNPEGERADSSKVIIEISLSTTTTMGTRQGHTAIIFPQSDFLSFRYEGKSFERKDDSSLHLITNKVLACYQREANKNMALLLNNHQLNWKDAIDYNELLEKPLASTLEKIKKEHLLLMPHVCDDTIPYLLGEGGILEEINDLKTLHDTRIASGTEGNDEINNIKINLSNILIDSLDDAKVNLEKVIDSMLKTFLKLPYINDVKILEWCFNQSMQYSDDTTKIKHARSVIDHIDFNCDQSKIAETLFFNLNKEPYKNSPELQELIWEKLVVYVNDFNLSNQEKSRLILRLFDDVKLVFDKVPLSILVNDIFLKDFFMKQPDFAKWYFYQLLKSYEGEQMYLNELGYVYGDEEKTN